MGYNYVVLMKFKVSSTAHEVSGKIFNERLYRGTHAGMATFFSHSHYIMVISHHTIPITRTAINFEVRFILTYVPF